MRRLKNWPSRFAALVEVTRGRPFEWGTHDCCLWAANAVLAITGEDLAADLRGSYTTARGALARLNAIGGLEAAGARAGRRVELLHAGAGDVGLVTWPDGTESLAVCAAHTWMCAGDAGLVHLPLGCGKFAWGVGRE